jgi:hypothetical protein
VVFLALGEVNGMIKKALILLFLLTGCAVQHSQAPQIDAKTTYAINLESQVTQVNKDYASFFTDVGNAQRAGQLSASDVARMNVIGSHLKGIIEEADRLTKTYGQNYDASVAAQIGSLLAQAALDLSNLSVLRAAATGGK